MKKMIFVLLMVLPLIVLSQESYTITGTFKERTASGKIFLIYKSAGLSKVDSTAVINGSFAFSGKLTNINRAYLEFIDSKRITLPGQVLKPDVLSFYLDRKQINIFISDSLKRAVISGSKVNLDDNDFKIMMEPFRIRSRALRTEYYDLQNNHPEKKTEIAEIKLQIDQIAEDQLSLTQEYIRSHPDSYISLFAVREMAGPYSDNSKAAELFSTLSKQIRDSVEGKDLKRAFDGVDRAAIGRIAPEFMQPDTAGQIIKLSDFRGKYVFVDFWASWCRPCRAENPNVIKAFNTYKDKEFAVIGISIDQKKMRSAWIKAIKDDRLPWIQLIDAEADAKGAAALYGVRSIPSNFLIDPDGKIIARNLRGEDLEAKLKSIPGLNKSK